MFWLTLWNEGLHPLQWVAVFGGSAVAAYTDSRSRRIGNLLTLPMLAYGILWATSVAGTAGLADSLAACVVLATPYVLLYAKGGGGAGDAKLMGAIGAWLGMVHGLVVLVAVSVAAVVGGTAVLVVRRRRARREGLPGGSVGTIPYGIVVFVGVLIWLVGVLLWNE